MKLELVIRYLGIGKRCFNCGRSRETTRYVIRQGEDILQEFLLCDACQDKGFTIEFEPKTVSTDTRVARKRRLKISERLEREVARDIGGKRQPGSGNQDAKDDVRKIDEWRIEHKYTDSPVGFRLLVTMLDSLIKHANLAGEWPALVINFRRVAGSHKYAVIPYELFLEFVELLRGRKTTHS